MEYNKNETKEFLEYKRITTGLKRVTQIFLVLFLITAFLIFVDIKIVNFTIGISDGFGIAVMIIFGIFVTLFYWEYLDIKEHGLEKYKQKWYYV